MVLPKYPKLWLTNLGEMNPSIGLFRGLQENLREIPLQMLPIFYSDCLASVLTRQLSQHGSPDHPRMDSRWSLNDLKVKVMSK